MDGCQLDLRGSEQEVGLEHIWISGFHTFWWSEESSLHLKVYQEDASADKHNVEIAIWPEKATKRPGLMVHACKPEGLQQEDGELKVIWAT